MLARIASVVEGSSHSVCIGGPCTERAVSTYSVELAEADKLKVLLKVAELAELSESDALEELAEL